MAYRDKKDLNSLLLHFFQPKGDDFFYTPTPSHTHTPFPHTHTKFSACPWFRHFGLHFRSISWEQIDRIWSNFVYALTITRSRLGLLTRSRLGLLRVNFRKFIIWLRPLMIVKRSFLLSILWTNWSYLIKFSICVDLNQLVGWYCYISIFKIYNRVMALGYCQYFVSTQYLVKELMEFDLYFIWRFPWHYENTPTRIHRKFHLQKLKSFR